MNSHLPALTPKQLRRAADIKEKMVALQNELGRILGGSETGAAPRKRRRMSAAARARIGAAARA